MLGRGRERRRLFDPIGELPTLHGGDELPRRQKVDLARRQADRDSGCVDLGEVERFFLVVVLGFAPDSPAIGGAFDVATRTMRATAT